MKSKTPILSAVFGIFLTATAVSAQQADAIFHNGSIITMVGKE